MAAPNVLEAMETETYRLDALLAAQKDGSEIAAVNDGAEAVSEETAALLRRALDIAAETDGAYDPTVYPLMRTWGFADGSYRVPEQTELDALLERTGWKNVSVDGTAVSMPEGFALDLGGIGKGYAAGLQRDLESARRDIRAAEPGGKRLGAREQAGRHAWTVAIGTRTAAITIGTVQIADQCVVTSGGYQRYFETGRRPLLAIADPERRGNPARSG